MDEAVALRACELLFSSGHKNNGFSFYGGEPLLCRGLIKTVVEYCAYLNRGINGKLSYQLTTNGILLDEEFLELAHWHNISIALSHDGALQDAQRVFKDGRGTKALLEPKIDMLLKHQKNAIAMLTFIPKNVVKLACSVEWLYNRGFSRINLAFDSRRETVWDDGALNRLDGEYEKLVEFIAKLYDSPRPLVCLNFESKLASRAFDRPCFECRLGTRQPSIAPDGSIYPCNQFLYNGDYLMGNVFNGVDAKAQRRIMTAYRAPEISCVGCPYDKRCRHHCACANFSMTGDMHTVSKLQCRHEKMLIKHADELWDILADSSARFKRTYLKT